MTKTTNNDVNFAKIKVLGVGGAGNNVVDFMLECGVDGVDFINLNTDAQSLAKSICPNKYQVGEKLTRGLGAGANPETGKKAMMENEQEIAELLKDTDMLFLVAGAGGGTGTGGTPVVAKIARDMGILTIGMVTKPFGFEGMKKMKNANEGIEELKKYVDSIVVIPNEKLKYASDCKLTIVNAFGIANKTLAQSITSITDLITTHGYINLDFADVFSVLSRSGLAHMGIGIATGDDKAEVAASRAINSPLLETSIAGAKGLIINVTLSENASLDDVEKVSSLIAESASPDANIIWGTSFDPSFDDKIKVTVIAAGFPNEPKLDASNIPSSLSSQSTPSSISDRPSTIPTYGFSNPAMNAAAGMTTVFDRPATEPRKVVLQNEEPVKFGRDYNFPPKKEEDEDDEDEDSFYTDKLKNLFKKKFN